LRGKVVTAAAVSLDGYIAGPNETGFEHLFAWFDGGDFEVPMPDPKIKIKLSEADYPVMTEFWGRIGAFVCGRRLFDLSDGWAGASPQGWPTVVVTHSIPQDWVEAHPNAPLTFVTDGVASAVEHARRLAGDKDVCVASGKISSQALELGLIDELTLQIVPVLLGGGVPLFEQLANAPILLDGPTFVVQGNRVTHLRYTVRRA
jgi:dihydrofolate reductase